MHDIIDIMSFTMNKVFAVNILILIIILITPIVFVSLYERKYLEIIELGYEQQLQRITQELKQAFSTGQRKLQIDLTKLFQQSRSRDYPLEEQLKARLNLKVKANNQITAISNHKRINILNVLVLEARNQTVGDIKQKIEQGLQWFNRNYGMKMKVFVWKENYPFNINELEPNTLLLIVSRFRYEYIEQNIANRLRKGQYHDSYYQKQIIHELRNTNLFAHCRYTHQSCKLTTFLFLDPSLKTNSYLNIDNSLFIFDRFDKLSVFNAMSEYLQVWELQTIRQRSQGNTSNQLTTIYDLLRRQAYLQQSIRLLEYISFTHYPWINDLGAELLKKWKKSPESAYQFLLDGKHISPYIHSVEEEKIVLQFLSQIQQCWKNRDCNDRAEVNLITDTRLGRIDLFPNNFKAGVYLPLLILFIYPILIKLKDMAVFLMNLRKREIKSQTANEQKTKKE